MTQEQEESIEGMADNYAAGRKMAMSFKPLTISDVKEAFIKGAYAYEHIKSYEE